MDGEPLESPRASDEAATLREGIQPPPLLRARRRGLLLTAAVLGVGALVFVLWPRQAPVVPAKGQLANALIEIDPTTKQIIKVDPYTTSESAGGFFSAQPSLAVGEGSVWLGDGTSLLQVIARTGALQAPTRLFSYLVTRGAVAIGFGKVWLGSNGLTTVDPATGQLHAPVPLPGVGPLVKGDPRPVGSGVVVGGGGVWATTPSGVALVNGRTGKLIDFIRVPGSVDAIALGNSSVWVADKLAGTITEIDPKTHTSGAPILLSGSIDSIAVGGGGYVWVMDTAGGIVTPIDPGNPSQHQAIRIGSDPVDITFGLGRVWVADQASGTIWRIDPVTKVADPFLHVGGAVVAVAVDEADHTLWVDIGPGGRRIT